MSAAAALAKASPDGHTLMQATSSTLATNVTMYTKLPYDPANDIVSVALIWSIRLHWWSNRHCRCSVADLIKLAKERPLSYGSAGTGSFTHLTAELLVPRSGLR